MWRMPSGTVPPSSSTRTVSPDAAETGAPRWPTQRTAGAATRLSISAGPRANGATSATPSSRRARISASAAASSEDFGEAMLQEGKEAISERKPAERQRAEDDPGPGMRRFAIPQHILIDPDHVAERIEVDRRLEQRRQPDLEIERRRDEQGEAHEHGDEILQIPEERSDRR